MLQYRRQEVTMPPAATTTDDNQGPMIIAVTAVFWALAIIALGLRFWAMTIRKRKILVHDILVLFAFICSTALFICLIVSAENGLGQHAVDLMATPWKFTIFGKLLIAIQLLWCLAMTSVRLSIINLYSHLFSSSQKLRIACYVMTAVCAVWFIGDALTVFLICRPFNYNWDKTVDGSCGNVNAAYLSVHSTNFVVDSTIALMPLPVLWKLSMPMRRKIGVMLMFGLGATICAIAVARIALYQLALAYDQTDFTYSGSTLYLFTSIEPLLGIALACLPLLRPIGDRASNSPIVSWVKDLVPSSLRGTSWSRSKNSSGNDRYIPTGSQEGFQQLTHVTIGGTEHKVWVAPNEVRVTGGQKAIRAADKKWQDGSFEMVSNASTAR
ncbi:hypothetical protein QBC38DRAFT_489287 [Podospora fimiseda]|uniref:Rhodopsin domain-containing protein n=1 Tax=Podospora fimiseda TaxID=252190 RepID=A0AAN7BFZ3_9PEZI|nr:hypothetical protein QBC38DRAFT_489287 [Podospora fimiseda]